jgi:heat shock protein HslJ
MRASRGTAVALIVGVTLLASSCADTTSGPGAGGGELERITWILDRAASVSLVEGVPEEARVTIRFEDGEAGGVAACNHYGATYETTGDGGISFELGAMTEMACEEPIMALESAFVAALGDVTGHVVTDDALVLTGGEVELSFEAEQPLPLMGTQWRLDGIAEGETFMSTIAEASAVFADDGTVTGNASCNRYDGTYQVEEGSIRIAEVGTTKMACEDDVMAQEAVFLDALANARTWSIQGSTLSLYAEGERLLVTLVAVES